MYFTVSFFYIVVCFNVDVQKVFPTADPIHGRQAFHIFKLVSISIYYFYIYFKQSILYNINVYDKTV
jgi:hypothetical protein